jgi:hypothetical protein
MVVLTVVAIAVGSVLVGAGAAINLQLAFLMVVAVGCLAALAAPPSAWAATALVAALTFKGLVSLGLLPSVATFLDLPLCWGALLVAVSTRHQGDALLRRHMRWLGLLSLAVLLAWLFNPSEVLRPIVYLMLLGEPYAVAGALIACPPTPRMRAMLEKLLLALVVVQIPLAYFELFKLGPADRVQGTLYGAGAGAHVVSAVIVVGSIWMLQGGGGGRLGVARLPVLAALVPIPFFADAKQVIVALPIILLASSWRHGSRLLVVLRGGLALAAITLLFTVVKAGSAAQRDITQAQQGQGGKEAAALFVWGKLSGDFASLAFGKGPAETVSRAAFLTTPQFQKSGFQNSKSALAILGLRPAAIATEAQTVAIGASRGGTSLNTGVSSTLGVIGDLGFFGAVAYFGLLLSVFLRLRAQDSADAVAAAAGFAMFAVLGLVFDWWEQPPFGVFLGVLAGLALSRRTAGETWTQPPASMDAPPQS